MEKPNSKDKYISEYYCPKNTERPDLEKERLFYTKEAASKIDAIRGYIADKYEGNAITLTHSERKEKDMLLALLLYEAATRANTSGVFKAFHQGFGGRGKDALQRIFKPLNLPEPKLWNNKKRHKVFCADANKLAKKLAPISKVDVAYIDPPYNQHQYGSNYHLLNTICLNDKPDINKHFSINGKIIQKAGIRNDWMKTKSDYCCKAKASNAFSDLINSINAHYILVSYSTDGFISLDEMLTILSNKGKIKIVTEHYTKYRGGKQALTTKISNIEMVFIVDTSKKCTKNDIMKIKNTLIDAKYDLLINQPISIPILRTIGFKIKGNNGIRNATLKMNDYTISWILKDGMYFEQDQSKIEYKNKNIAFQDIPYDLKNEIVNILITSTNIDKEDELHMILEQIEYYSDKMDKIKVVEYFSQVPYLLKKFNNRKNMISSLNMIKRICDTIEFLREKMSSLFDEDKFNKKIIQLHNIIIDKINYKAFYITKEIIKHQQKLNIFYGNFLQKHEIKMKVRG